MIVWIGWRNELLNELWLLPDSDDRVLRVTRPWALLAVCKSEHLASVVYILSPLTKSLLRICIVAESMRHACVALLRHLVATSGQQLCIPMRLISTNVKLSRDDMCRWKVLEVVCQHR